jgi:hypothetical protein
MQFYAQELSAVQAAVEAAAPSEGLVLHSEPDRYGGVLIGPDALPSDPSEFQQVRATRCMSPLTTRERKSGAASRHFPKRGPGWGEPRLLTQRDV